jgi:GNAT superfamily N-acetyltransferase
VEVRRADADDLAAVAEVHVRSWQETYAGLIAQDLLDGLSVERRRTAWTQIHAASDWPATGILVLVDDGTVAGFAHVGPSRDTDATENAGEVTAIYLRRARWGRGGGQALIAAALRTLAEAGFTTAVLWVLDANERARRFYEAGGWALDGATKDDTIGGQRVTSARQPANAARRRICRQANEE